MAELELQLPLGDATAAPTHPAEPIVRSAFIDGDHRFWLKRAWGPGPAIAWVGLNPSTADGKSDDPTMRAEIGFSFRWGYGSLVKVNIYPFRAADPRDLQAWLDAARAELPHGGGEKDAACRRNLTIAGVEIRNCKTVIAAWGEGAAKYDVEVFMRVVQGGDPITGEPGPYQRQWYCLARTNSGAPRHTLARGHHFIPRDAQPAVWTPVPTS